ncbi:MAG TPA: hypothetical protein VMU34_14000 [Mycobacterium sp.]|nr:hypothetical protein [Mycobacterium sp.]
MRLEVLLGGILRVLDGLNVVGMSQMSLVGGFLKRSLDLVFSGFEVVLGGLFEMFSCLLVLFSCLRRHVFKPLSKDFDLEREQNNRGLSAAWPTFELQDC